MSCGDIPDGLATEEQGEALMPRKKKIQRFDKSLCQKCRESKSMYIIRNVTYCKPCFEYSLFTRFIRTLHPILKTEAALNLKEKDKKQSRIALNQGGTRPDTTNGSILIGLSGGSSSISLLNMLIEREYIGKGDDKKIDRTKGEKQPVWNKGYIIHVDFSDLIDDSNSQDRSDILKQWVESKENELVWIGLKAYDVYDANLKNKIRKIVGLSEEKEFESSGIAVDLKNPDLPIFPIASSSSSTSTPLDQLRSILATLPPASRPSLLSSILNSLITVTSDIIPNVSHVLLGETSTRQAQRLISGTALGKGYTLPLELAVTNKPYSKYTILKPMKDITIKEVSIYTHLKGLNSIVRNDRKWDYSGPISKKDSRGKDHTRSLESLTEQFIANLGVTHPATVSTINRTGDKLTFTGEKQKGISCPVCQMPVDPNALEWKSRTALTSLPSKANVETVVSEIDQGLDEGKQGRLATLLCYACLTTFTPPTVVSKVIREEATPVQLPIWVEQNLNGRHEMGRNEMRDEIKDFLISEE
ncbi:uncharacterized protein I206_102343 [Kwoniella pini CBS 10737]|uniref:Cytoplasmic tRNA 2-thiolation protein 2 n=1 Tax=Kwoniella pini CBS 10737 TaxID=1296096 RepID=A0A1B9I543_9TREE|nr:uncharacterized protein I206_02690 [Kwoniella pini CBS 10737]OCF50636.1 hypothetical protein I206_02690 [Kwoniella pini CBS 10737]